MQLHLLIGSCYCLFPLCLCVHSVGDVHYLQKPTVMEGTTVQITTFIPKGQSIIPQSTNGALTKSDCLLTSASKVVFIFLYVSFTCTLSRSHVSSVALYPLESD